MKKLKGLTLIELLIAVALIAILVGAFAYVFRAVLLTWSSQETRAGVTISLSSGVTQMVRDLRSARSVGVVNSDELRFTPDSTNYYIYYLYNSRDHYPPAFNQSIYDLKRAVLTGGINGSFAYGSGNIILKNTLPPPASDLSFSGNLVVIDLSATIKNETIWYRTRIRPRNI